MDGLSPVSNGLSPVIKEDLNTKSKDIGDTGDKLGYIMKDKEYVSDNKGNININNSCINYPKASDSRIEHNHLFYYLTEHPKFQNIYLEVIESHLILAKDHQRL